MAALRLPVLITGLCLPLWSGAGLEAASDLRRNQLRDAVEAHRASQREETRRVEAWAGRRLTPAELAELRSQVRRQSPGRLESQNGPSAGVPGETVQPAAPPYFPARSQRR